MEYTSCCCLKVDYFRRATVCGCALNTPLEVCFISVFTTFQADVDGLTVTSNFCTDIVLTCCNITWGINCVFEAILLPLYQIAENAGFDGNEIIKKQLEEKDNVGFDAKEGKWVNMFEKGIVDPTKVTRYAVLNAASIASLFVTTEAGVVTKEDPNNNLANAIASASAGGQGMY